MNHLNDKDFAELKTRLQTMLRELLDIISASPDESGTVELDQSRFGRLSRMDAIQVQAMSGETARRRKIELARVEAALKRMDEDDYGYCVSCEEEISPERLKVNPSAPLCIECAGKAERRK